ncbi:MAG: mechanosensitive ion channel family protein, partial [Pseudomonadota bacterium]|nr:mechanosensitive ion channel family protein [Pseudomonadota bacterium]
MESTAELQPIIEEVVHIATSYSVDVLGAVVTLVVGWMLAGWARRGVLRATSPLTWMDQTLRPLLASLARYGVLVITVVAVLNQ